MKKKVLALLLMAAMMLTFLTACGKSICFFCGEEKRCTTKKVLGEEIDICKDCLETLTNG